MAPAYLTMLLLFTQTIPVSFLNSAQQSSLPDQPCASAARPHGCRSPLHADSACLASAPPLPGSRATPRQTSGAPFPSPRCSGGLTNPGNTCAHPPRVPLAPNDPESRHPVERGTPFDLSAACVAAEYTGHILYKYQDGVNNVQRSRAYPIWSLRVAYATCARDRLWFRRKFEENDGVLGLRPRPYPIER